MKFGQKIAQFAKDHPAIVATVAATAAVFSPPPLDFALGMLAFTASAAAGSEALEDRKYAEAAIDFVSAAVGVGAVGARGPEILAERAHSAAGKGLESLTREIMGADPADVASLTGRQRAAFDELVERLNVSRVQAGKFRAAERKGDIRAAVLALVGEPHIDPAINFHHR